MRGHTKGFRPILGNGGDLSKFSWRGGSLSRSSTGKPAYCLCLCNCSRLHIGYIGFASWLPCSLCREMERVQELTAGAGGGWACEECEGSGNSCLGRWQESQQKLWLWKEVRRQVWSKQERIWTGETESQSLGEYEDVCPPLCALGRRGTKQSLYMLYVNKSSNYWYSYANSTVIAAWIEFKFKTQDKRAPAFLPPQQMSTFILNVFPGLAGRALECFYLCNRSVDMILRSSLCYLQVRSMLCNEHLYFSLPCLQQMHEGFYNRTLERQLRGKWGSERSQLC